VRAAFPDLDTLNPDELKALIISLHEPISSREAESEHSKPLIANRAYEGNAKIWRSPCMISDGITNGRPC
jgi:hypothetical protein